MRKKKNGMKKMPLTRNKKKQLFIQHCYFIRIQVYDGRRVMLWRK